AQPQAIVGRRSRRLWTKDIDNADALAVHVVGHSGIELPLTAQLGADFVANVVELSTDPVRGPPVAIGEADAVRARQRTIENGEVVLSGHSCSLGFSPLPGRLVRVGRRGRKGGCFFVKSASGSIRDAGGPCGLSAPETATSATPLILLYFSASETAT